MSAAELASMCAVPSTLSVAGIVALMVIASFVGRIFAIALVGRMRGRIDLPPSVLLLVVVAAGSVAVMTLVRLGGLLSALIVECPGTLVETIAMAVLFVVAAFFGVSIAGHFGSQLFEEFESAPEPEPQSARTESLMVDGTVSYARLGAVLQSLAVQNGYEVTWAEVYELLPRVELFQSLPPADSDRLIFKLAAEILNAEAMRIGSRRRTTAAEIRELVAA